jgi:hypothetical protein
VQRLVNVQPHQKVCINSAITKIKLLELSNPNSCNIIIDFSWLKVAIMELVFVVVIKRSIFLLIYRLTLIVLLLNFFNLILEQRSQLQQKGRLQEDVRVRTSLPPSIEGPVYAILICHIPKLRWLAKYQSLCRSVTIKVAWWGENDTSTTFK